jgi:CHAD domain-containing protein
MQEYARQQAATLLEKLAVEIDRAARSHGAEGVHDLRVAIRRLGRCLRCFARLYPGHWRKKTIMRLVRLRDLAGAVRDRDIVLELLAKARMSSRSPILIAVAAERRKAHQELLVEIDRWRDRGFIESWREQLDGKA